MLLLLAACTSLCDRAVDARVAAGELTSAEVAAAEAQCEADLRREGERVWIEATAACAGEGAAACVRDVEVRRAGERARASGDWGVVATLCVGGGGACGALLGEGAELLTARVLAARDAGSDPIEACVDLMRVAEPLGDEARQAATLRCAEAEAARYAAEGAAQAAANLTADKLDLPLACGMALERLDALGNEWATAKAQETTRACYGQLGKRVLAVAVDGGTWGCSFDGRRVYEAVRDHDVHEPELDRLMARAAPLCGGD